MAQHKTLTGAYGGIEDATVKIVAKAVATERERCAKTVEILFYAPSSVGGDLILCGDTLDAAAKAIRDLRD